MSMKNRKKEKVEVEDQVGLDAGVEGPMALLAEALIKDAIDKAASSRDPFETYEHQLYSHLHHNPSEFKERFIKGYKLLLQDIH